MSHYSNDTLRKYTARAQERLNYYLSMPEEEFSNIHVKLSKGDSKIGKTVNNALLPIITCGNCASCAHHCYDVKACMRFPVALENRAINTAVAMRDPVRYFNETVAQVSKVDSMRWHQGGEILSGDYLSGMVDTAQRTPNTAHWGYTHMHDTVNQYIASGGIIPTNLSIMYSAEDDKPINNPYHMPEFRCITKGNTPPAGYMECKGDCSYCKAHHCGCIAGQNVYAWEH